MVCQFMKKLSKLDWLNEGFKLLSEFAQDKLKIQLLCVRLGVTRGSFYHHFSGIEDYVLQLLELWQYQNTIFFIEQSKKGRDPEEQMEILASMVVDANQSVEAAIRSWSFYDDVALEYLKKVDQLRLDYLEEVFINMGTARNEARLRAELDYATLIGVQQLFPKASAEHLADLWRIQKTISINKK